MNDFIKRVLVPAMIPLGAFAFIGALVFGFSRILLAVPKDGSVVVGVLIAGCILFAAGAVAKGGKVKLAQRAALVAFAMLVLVGGVATGLSIGTRPFEGHLEVAAEISAQNTKFDKTELALPAGRPFIIEFNNKDALLHNVAIYDKSPATATAAAPVRTFFKPPLATGPRVIELEVKTPISAGVWYFQCDAHTTMNGIARVGGATGSPSPGGASPGPAASPPPASPPASPSPSPSPSPASQTNAIALTAGGNSFDKKTLTWPAAQRVLIDFNNQDASPHNFALYRDPGFSQNIFRPAGFFTGPGTTRYEFPSPGPGTYYFQCDTHPQASMRGTLTIR